MISNSTPPTFYYQQKINVFTGYFFCFIERKKEEIKKLRHKFHSIRLVFDSSFPFIKHFPFPFHRLIMICHFVLRRNVYLGHWDIFQPQRGSKRRRRRKRKDWKIHQTRIFMYQFICKADVVSSFEISESLAMLDAFYGMMED